MSQNIEIIWKVMGALENPQGTEEALTEALEIIRKQVQAEDATLWLKNREEKRLYAIVHSGENNVAGYSMEEGEGVVGGVCQSGEPLTVDSTVGDARFPGGNDGITGAKVKNAAYLPLKLPHETIGCLQLVNLPEGGLKEEDAATLRTFCGLSAMVIDEKGFSFAQGAEKKAVLSFRNVIKEFQNGSEVLQALKGVDMDVYEGEFLVILGESGCGKSTMLNIIGGMDSMTSGTMEMDGKDFSHPTEDELTNYRRDYIGFIFQAYNLMPNLTALENVEFIAENSPTAGDSKAALDRVGLTQWAGNYPSMMSGGQQQRVSIARAIVKNPKVILADEPTAALDYETSIEVLDVIEKLVREQHTTVVMVTHNSEIAKMANRVVRFKNGKIVSVRINAWPVSARDLEW